MIINKQDFLWVIVIYRRETEREKRRLVSLTATFLCLKALAMWHGLAGLVIEDKIWFLSWTPLVSAIVLGQICAWDGREPWLGSGHFFSSAEGKQCFLSPHPANEAAVNLGQARAMAAGSSEALPSAPPKCCYTCACQRGQFQFNFL